ncbi:MULTISPECIES: hypothetical protein [Lysinibacillus]|uniref:TFIIB-type zinc ribbon-containing protein n=1 Tax=Lysinibacillus antri TaxID=2498145 RepID=A0A3S0WFC3_9BACI|nr:MULTISPECIES: hypothetical protein [Lysinibacillus]RUL50510.1 hypothetical protein EK386_14080 [Lysinibacillus antri]TSI07708.1 hypothetical protein FJQ64_08425 [Lysinibacillus sp. BW-2-10]
MTTPNDHETLVEVHEHDAKCPSCGASIKFNPVNGKLTCPYCHHEEEIPDAELELDEEVEELDFESAVTRSSFSWGAEKKVVICDACAAEMVYDALEVANVCPYCGSNHVMESHAENSLAPNGIVPFEVSSQQADENFRKWIKSRWFAPNKAKRSAKAEAFSGIYLPYWTFDTKTASQYTAKYGKDRTETDSEGDTHTVTDWYNTSGFYQEFIDDHLILATTRYQMDILEKIEPFKLKESRPYKRDFLSGYIAERYSIGLEDGWTQAKKEIHAHLKEQIKNKITYEHNADHVKNIKFSTVHSNITYKYLMLPVWLSSFKYKNKSYQFMVNGQTGQVGGQSPISPIKVTFAVILALIVLAIVYFFFVE